MKFYRVDKVASDLKGKIMLDDTYYIEKKQDSSGRVYYLMVEDYTHYGKGKYSYRIRKDIAENRIGSGKYVK
jgi:hypothetical protein